MAKSKKDNGKENGKQSGSFFRDERFRFSSGIFILLFSLFLLLSFISYMFTWKIDQSFDWSKTVSEPAFTVDNWAGKTGAFLSNHFINKWFGLPSLLFPFLFALFGFRMLGVKLLALGKSIRATLMGVILLSISLGYLFGEARGFLGSGPGGAHGYYMAHWLNAFAGKAGTAFILFVFLIAYMVFTFKGSLEALKSIWWTLFTRSHSENKAQQVDPLPEKKLEEEIVLIDDEEAVSKEVKVVVESEIDLNGNNTVPLTVLEVKGAGETLDEENWIHPYLETDYDPTLDLPDFKFPPLSLLEEYKSADSLVSKEELINNKNRIVETLANYKIQIDKITANIGSTVTLYEIVPAPGIRISKIKNL